jgi:hypothetical protein
MAFRFEEGEDTNFSGGNARKMSEKGDAGMSDNPRRNGLN